MCTVTVSKSTSEEGKSKIPLEKNAIFRAAISLM